MSKKDVNEVVNDVQEAVEDIADQVQDEVTDVVTKEDGKIKKVVKKHGKRVAIDILLFAAGVGAKTLFDMIFGGGVNIPETNVAGNVVEMPVPDAKVDTAI